MMPGRPPSARAKLVAGFTSTRRCTRSGAAAATRRPRQPPKDSATNVTCVHAPSTWVLSPPLHAAVWKSACIAARRDCCYMLAVKACAGKHACMP